MPALLPDAGRLQFYYSRTKTEIKHLKNTMNRLSLLPVLLAFLLLVAGCSPNGPTGQLLHGKLIMSTGCGNYMLQVTQGTLPSDKINSTWKDPLTGNVYTNVFTVLNRCVLYDTAFHFGVEF